MIFELGGRVPADVCHQEPSFSLRGPAKAPKPTSAEGASYGRYGKPPPPPTESDFFGQIAAIMKMFSKGPKIHKFKNAL